MFTIEKARPLHWLSALLLASVVIPASNSYAQDPSPAQDRALRRPEIVWPPAFDPDHADLFAHNEIQIGASCRSVWRHLTAAVDWPRWYPNSAKVQLSGGTKDGTLHLGTRFSWRTFGIDVKSEVVELVPLQRLAWTGKTADIDAYHTWYLSEQSGACHVVTEESANGAGARALVARDPGGMHRGHELWLVSLKNLSAR